MDIISLFSLSKNYVFVSAARLNWWMDAIFSWEIMFHFGRRFPFFWECFELCNTKFISAKHFQTVFSLNYSQIRRFFLFKKRFRSKGQLISKCPFGIIVWTKYQRNYFWISALKFFVSSWGLPGSFLGLPVGFLVYDITY